MRLHVITICLLLAFGCSEDNKVDANDTSLVNNSATASGEDATALPNIQFDKEVHDFGMITQGERVNTEFSFTNSGETNLIISDARGSCGCTVPEWPKQPISPGGRGVLKVAFNSEGKSGLQEKTITVVTNCEPATRVVRIKANIVVPETAK